MSSSPATPSPRVVVATRVYSPEPAAAAFRLSALVTALAARGARVSVLTVRPPGAGRTGRDRVGAVRVRRWPVWRDADGVVRGYLSYLSFDLPLVLRLAFARRPDVVVVEPPPTSGAVVRAVCALRRIPYVAYAPDIWSDAALATDAPAFLVRAVRWIEAWTLTGARRVLAVSEQIAARVREMGPDPAAVVVVDNGADTKVFTPQGPRARSDRYLLYAGTTSQWQGAELFIHAMPTVLAAAPDARLVFLGQGSEWASLREHARALPAGTVEFHDAVPPREAATWLRGAVSCLVSLRPGTGYEVATPTKIFAAAASGVPVVFAGVGPAGPLVRRAELGHAVDYDVHAVAAAMVAVLDREWTEGEREREGRRLSRWARSDGSIEKAGERSAAVVLGVVEEHRRARRDRARMRR